MTKETFLKIDTFFRDTEGLVSVPRIRELLLKSGLKSPNPPINKLSLIEIGFTDKDGSNLETVKKNIKPFQFDIDLDEENEFDYFGPVHFEEEDAVYIGQLNHDVRIGKGIQFYSDGSFYEGYFQNNSAHRKGRLIFQDADMYVGQLIENSMSGTGTYYKKDGSKYVGNFLEDLPHGDGVEEWEDGSKYTGGYVKGCKQGYGNFMFANGTKFEGEFVQDIFDGTGTLTKVDGTICAGEWEQGQLTSPAKIIYPNGNKFNGTVDGLLPHGKGKMVEHGTEFEGSWKNSKMEGEFTITYPDGKVRGAIYDEGKFVQWVGDGPSNPEIDNKTGRGAKDVTPGDAGDKKKGGFLCCGKK